MDIILNGESRKFPDGISVQGLVEHLQLSGQRLAIEVNLEIVPRSRYGEQILHDGDKVEIVHAIGGG